MQLEDEIGSTHNIDITEQYTIYILNKYIYSLLLLSAIDLLRFVTSSLHKLLAGCLYSSHLGSCELPLPTVVREVARSECVVVAMAICACHVFCVSVRPYNLPDMLGPRKSNVRVNALQSLVSIINQILVSHSNVPVPWQSLLKLHVVQHPGALKGGIFEKTAPNRPFGDGVEDPTRIAHQVDNLDISLIKPGLKTSPSQSDRLDNSGVRTSTSHSTLSYRWEAALVELLQERPRALEDPAKVALHKVRLARVSHDHVLYCRSVWSQAEQWFIIVSCPCTS